MAGRGAGAKGLAAATDTKEVDRPTKKAKMSLGPPPTCSICCEEGVGRFGECPKCGECICSSCVDQYAQHKEVDLDCPNCEHPWSRAFLASFMQKYWMQKGYKLHREKVVWARERPKIPEAMPVLESKRYAEHLRRESFRIQAEAEAEKYRLQAQLRRLDLDYDRASEVIREEERFIRGERDDRPDPFIPSSKMTADEVEKASREAKKSREVSCVSRGHCPRDDCSGLIGEGWKCVVCSTHVCRTCMKARDDKERHICNPEDVLSIEQIRKDSKPCPSCRVRVFKIHGCSQMFCTACKSAFDWNSGKLITNLRWVHNPHMTEFLRENSAINIAIGGDAGGGVAEARDIARHAGQCRDDISNVLLRNAMDGKNLSRQERQTIYASMRRANEILDTMCVPYNSDLRVRDLRVRMLEGRISEEELAVKLQRLDKAVDKSLEEVQIYHMYATVVLDTVLRFIQEPEMSYELCIACITEAYWYAVSVRRKLFKHFGSTKKAEFGAGF